MSKRLNLCDIGLPQDILDELASKNIKTLTQLCRQDYGSPKLSIFKREILLGSIVDDVRDDLLKQIPLSQLKNIQIATKAPGGSTFWHQTYGTRLIFGQPLVLKGYNLIEILKKPKLGMLTNVTFKQMIGHYFIGKKSANYVLGRLKALGLINNPEIEMATKPIVYKKMAWAKLMAKHPTDLIEIDKKNSILLSNEKVFKILNLISLTEQDLRAIGITLKQVKIIKKSLKPYQAFLRKLSCPDYMYGHEVIGFHTGPYLR